MQEPDVHRHRVGVVEQPGVGALGEHVLRQVVQEAEGPQAAEHAADPERVGDGLAQPEAGRDLEVGQRRRVAADVDRVDDEVGPRHRRRPVERGRGSSPAGCAAPPRSGPAPRPARARRGSMSCMTSVRRAEVVEGQQVAQQLAGELRRTGTDEADGSHAGSMSRWRQNEQDRTGFLLASGQTAHLRGENAVMTDVGRLRLRRCSSSVTSTRISSFDGRRRARASVRSSSCSSTADLVIGGSAGITAHGFARLGRPVALAAAVGADSFGATRDRRAGRRRRRRRARSQSGRTCRPGSPSSCRPGRTAQS